MNLFNLNKLIKIIFCGCLIVLIFFGISTLSYANTGIDSFNPVVVYFFYAYRCTYCEKARQFLVELNERYPQIEIMDFETYLSPENRAIYKELLMLIGSSPQGMPTIIIGNKIWAGFQPLYEKQIEVAVLDCIKKGCVNAGEPLGIKPLNNNYIELEFTPLTNEQELSPNNLQLNIPLFGMIDLSSTSILISTIIIGLVDGFNPCSLWILSILLSLTLYTHSRKKIFFVGSIFLLTTAVVYSLFITGVFSVISYLAYVEPIRIVVGLIAAIFGLINLKDYFAFKRGFSLTISDRKKPKIYQKMRSVIFNKSGLMGLTFGTITLATSVSLLEFSCTAGFPIVWGNLLSQNNIGYLTYLALLVVYMAMYLFDEIFVFLSVVITMHITKLEQKHGQLLKLLSGSIMFFLATAILFYPEIMYNINSALLVFICALLVSLFIHTIYSRLKMQSF